MTKLSNLDLLLDGTVSLAGACGEIADRYLRSNPAASSTIDALMYSLRKGPAVLGRADVQQRLIAVDEDQMRDICKQLRSRHPEVAKSWAVADVEALVLAWAACHG